MKIDKNVVKRLRVERSWSQEHLSYLCNVSIKTIQRVERDGICCMETRAALASVLEIELKQLSGEEKIEQAKTNTSEGLMFLSRIFSGKMIVDILVDTFAFRFDYENPQSQNDAEFISDVIQEIKDWGEIWSDLDIGEQIKSTYRLDQLLLEIEQKGFFIFGLRTKAIFKVFSQESEESISNLYIGYKNGANVIILNPDKSR